MPIENETLGLNAMTDDIVTRLRTSYNASLVTSELLPDEIEDMKKAADEIERLRKERTYYEEMCSMIADKNFTANQEVDRLRAELKAVRNG